MMIKRHFDFWIIIYKLLVVKNNAKEGISVAIDILSLILQQKENTFLEINYHIRIASSSRNYNI